MIISVFHASNIVYLNIWSHGNKCYANGESSNLRCASLAPCFGIKTHQGWGEQITWTSALFACYGGWERRCLWTELSSWLCSVLSDPQTIVKNETFRKLWSRLQLCLNWCFLGMQITETIKPTTHRAAALSLHYNVSSSSLNHKRVNGTEHDKNLSAKPTKPPSNLRLAFVFWLFG